MRKKNIKNRQSVRFIAGAAFSLFFCLFSVTSAQAATSTFTVSNANDSGAGSIRKAIIDCNAISASDDCIISLENAGGTQTVTLSTGLPIIQRKAVFQNTDTSTIDLILDGSTGDASVRPYCLSFGPGSDNSVLEGIAMKDCMDTVGIGSGALDITSDFVTIGSGSLTGQKVFIYGGRRGITTSSANTTIQHTIIGRNIGGTVDGTVNYGILVASTATNTVIDNVIVDSSSQPNIAASSASGVTVTNTQSLNSTSHGFEFSSATNVTIDDTIISNNNCAVRMIGGSSHIYRSNTITIESTQRGFCISDSPSDIRIGASNGAGLAADGNTFSGNQLAIDLQDSTPSNVVAGFNTFDSAATQYIAYDSGSEPFSAASSIVAKTTSVEALSGASTGSAMIYQGGVYKGTKAISSSSFSATVAGGDLTGSLTSGQSIVILTFNNNPIPTNSVSTTVFDGTISTPTVTPTSSQVSFLFSSTETLKPKIYIATSEGGLSGATANTGTLGTSHSKTITGLSASTIYYYRIDTVDSSDDITRTGVQTGTFTTSAPPDTTAPVLQSFTTDSTSGRYGPGAVITITATYDETINASSTMQVTLNNSGSVSLSGVVATATLTGTYTVPSTGAGGGTGDLTVSMINSESVTDLATSPNTRTNSLVPSGLNNIGGAKDIVVDTTGPTVSEITAVTTPTNDTTPNYIFTTNEAGTIAFTLGSCRSTTTSASSGSNTITLDSNGSGGALSDGSYTNCRLTVTDLVDFGSGNTSAALSITSFTIATSAPALTQFATLTTSGTYTTGQTILIGAQFARTLNSASIMTVRLTNGVEVDLAYNPAYGGNIIAANYVVGDSASGEDDSDLQIASILSYSIIDTLGNSTTTPPSIVGITQLRNAMSGLAVTLVVETGATPVIDSISSDAANGSYSPGDSIDIDVTFSEPVTSTGSVTVTLETGTTDQTCTFTITDSRTGTCNYIVQEGDTTADLDATISGTIKDHALNTLTDFTPGTTLAANKNIVIDSGAPTISEVTPVSTPTTDNTPSYTFTTNEAGTISYGGDCSSATTSANSGSNTITFNTLSDGAHTNCTITVTDAAGNASNTLNVASFTVDATAPTISEVTPVSTPTTDNTPSYTFTTNEAGTISYGGDCSSATTSASSGSNTITFNTLADGAHTNCTITVTDTIGNVSNTLNVASFTIDAVAPTILVVTPVSTPTTDNTPNYTFTTNEAGSLSYGGDCASSAVSASVGSNTITFAELADGAHTNCTITVTDAAGNASNVLNVASFTIDATAPVIAITAPTLSATTTITNTTIRVTDARAISSSAVTVDAATTAGHDAISCTQTSGTQVDCTIAITSSGNLKIAAQDALGNVATPATQAGYVIVATTPSPTPSSDTTAPNAPVIVASNGGNASIVTSTGVVQTKTPTFQGTAEALATVIVRDNNSNTLCTTTVGSDGTWNCTATSALAVGSQAISIVAMDAAGNVSSATSVTFTRASVTSSYTIQQKLISPKAKKGKYPTVAKGKTVKYTVKIKNTGEASLTKLKLTQTYPKATLKFKKGTVKPNSTKKKGTLVWNNVLKNKPLAVGATRTITVSYVVKDIPAKKSARTLTVASKATGGKDVYNVTARNRTTKNKKLKVQFSLQDARFQSFIRFGNERSSAQYSPKAQSVSLARGQTLLKFEDGTDNDFNDFQLIMSYKTASAQFEFIPVSVSANLDHTLYFRFVVNGKTTDIPVFRSTKQFANVDERSPVVADVNSLLQ